MLDVIGRKIIGQKRMSALFCFLITYEAEDNMICLKRFRSSISGTIAVVQRVMIILFKKKNQFTLHVLVNRKRFLSFIGFSYKTFMECVTNDFL